MKNLLLLLILLISINAYTINLDVYDTKPGKYTDKFYKKPNLEKEKYMYELYKISISDIRKLLDEDTYDELNGLNIIKPKSNKEIVITNLTNYVDCWNKKDVVCFTSYYDSRFPDFESYITSIINTFKKEGGFILSFKNIKIKETKHNEFEISFIGAYPGSEYEKIETILYVHLENGEMKIYNTIEILE